MWLQFGGLKIPPRVHFFLWPLMNNKVLTRDNLGRRRKVEDESCLLLVIFFFSCAVAKQMWTTISEVLKVYVGRSFIEIGNVVDNK